MKLTCGIIYCSSFLVRLSKCALPNLELLIFQNSVETKNDRAASDKIKFVLVELGFWDKILKNPSIY